MDDGTSLDFCLLMECARWVFFQSESPRVSESWDVSGSTSEITARIQIIPLIRLH